MKRKGGSNSGSKNSKTRTKTKKYSTANLTPQQNLSDNFNLPEELLREVASFLTIDEKVTLYKTQWEKFSPRLKFLYTYEGDRDPSDPNKDTDYELEEGEIDVSIADSVLEKIRARIVKHIRRSLLRYNNKKKILPKDIDYVHVYIVLRPAVTRKGRRREQISRPPDDGNQIEINATLKGHDYSVYIDGFEVVMHPAATDKLLATSEKSKMGGFANVNNFRTKIYAHLI